jgi:uncharacterized membrane-anchored protein YhcB (DUF1043 family)
MTSLALSWLKGSWLWLAVIAALVAGLLVLNGQVSAARLDAARAEKVLEKERGDRAVERADREAVARREFERLAGLFRGLSAQYGDLTHDLHKAKDASARAAADQRATAERLRGTAADLAAARDRLTAIAGTAAKGSSGGGPGAIVDLLVEAGSLVEEAGRVGAEGTRIVGQRDAEVKMLKAALLAERAANEAPAAP